MDKIKLIKKIYHKQLRSSKDRGHNPPTYTKQQLINWVQSQPNFIQLYNNWIKVGKDKYSVPSVDRIDDNLGYSISNIRLVTWRENLLKAGHNIKLGLIKRSGIRRNRLIHQINDGIIVNTFISMWEADRQTGIAFQNISKVCRGLRPKAGGYKWKYAD